MVQPLDTTHELTAEELDTAAFRSRLTNACDLTSNEEQRLQKLLEKHQRSF